MPSNLLEKPLPAAVEPGLRKSVLIVDDDDALADVLSRRLQRQGFDTQTAASGRDGLVIAQSEHPNLIILDLRLPDIDGFSICEELADTPQTSDIPVIILSGMEQPDILRRCRAAGCRYFLRKPYDPNAMLILIQQAIQEAGPWDDLPSQSTP